MRGLIMKTKKLALSFLACAGLVACHEKSAPTPENFTRALTAYLAERGELCVGKTEWPIDLTQRERELGIRDAKQMPVLERLGLVSSSDAITTRKTEDGTVEISVKRYELTPLGLTYYHPRVTTDGQGKTTSRPDFCVATLTLDQIKSSQVTTSSSGQKSAVVFYTYHVAPAPWTADPEAQQVFPAVAHVIQGAGKDELREELTFTDQGWVANELLGTPGTPAPTASQASAR
jgi:hypothetical protein